jgi:hypothetical protein
MAQSERVSAIERVMEAATPAISPKALSLRFWYGGSIAEFLSTRAQEIVGQLTLNSSFDVDRSQAAAWLTEIEFLQLRLSDLAGSIFFEFNIPRMGRRIDVVLVIGPVIFAIEFKVGEKIFDRSALDQVWDYGLVIFDEAQRAWNLKQTASFMLRKKRVPGFADSEPEFLISYMDRRKDWAVIVCLVGGGQEINTGEAGIDAWLDAVNRRFPDWEMFISDRLTDTEYAAGRVLEIVRERPRTKFDDSLHLAVSMRSFRAENVSAFVKALLDCEKEAAKSSFAELTERYPIAITRDLNAAKRWIRDRARGTERYGLVASSKALRLKPHAIDIRVSVDPVHYFLNHKDDTRSSYYLEDAATEFQVQGLELDWVCVNWDADFRFNGYDWNYHDFRGNRWCNISNANNRMYLRNAYRVLLTRARQGMVVFVPPGDSSDPTRLPAFYNSTFNYLVDLGIQKLPDCLHLHVLR